MIKEYLTSTLGPYIVNVTLAAKLCSRLVCNNHGRCIRRRMDSDTYLHLNSSSFNIRVNSNDSHTQVSVTGALSSQQKDKMRQEFTCHCYQGWQGERCHIRENTRGQGLTLQTWDWCLPVAVLTAVLEWH